MATDQAVPSHGGEPVAAATKDGVVDERFQVGVPGQFMEPFISVCAKAKRSCEGKFFCGC